MNDIIFHAFHDELEKLSGVSRLARVNSTLAKLYTKLSDQASTGTSYPDQATVGRIKQLSRVRDREAEKLKRRVDAYGGKRDLYDRYGPTYARRTGIHHSEIPKYRNKASPDSWKDADDFAAFATRFREDAQGSPKDPAGWPTKIVRVVARTRGGTGVPPRTTTSLSQRDQQNWAKSKREVEEALQAADRKRIEKGRAARDEVYRSSLKGRLDRIKRLTPRPLPAK